MHVNRTFGASRRFGLVFLVTIVLSMICAPYNESSAAKERVAQSVAKRGEVVRIIDGDTIEMLTRQNEAIKIRLEHIDAPEKKQAFTKRSKQLLSDLVFQEEVILRGNLKKDRYGRLIAVVFRARDELEVNLEMIKQGMAWHFKRYSKDETYAKAEIEARESKRGLHADQNAMPPWEFRKLR